MREGEPKAEMQAGVNLAMEFLRADRADEREAVWEKIEAFLADDDMNPLIKRLVLRALKAEGDVPEAFRGRHEALVRDQENQTQANLEASYGIDDVEKHANES